MRGPNYCMINTRQVLHGRFVFWGVEVRMSKTLPSTSALESVYTTTLYFRKSYKYYEVLSKSVNEFIGVNG